MGLIFIAIVVIVIVGGLVISFFRDNFKKSLEEAGRAQVDVDVPLAGQGVALLKQRDPTFDQQTFAARAATVMEKVNEAWCAGNMGPARRLISDGVYVRFQTQLQLLKHDNQRNVMADWAVTGCEILSAESDPQWDTVHVKLAAQARDVTVPATSTREQLAEAAAGARIMAYQEVWSFLRRRGGKSKGGVPALEGRCPNCGADLPLGDAVRCQYCKAIVNSGEHDWVLAEITQPEEWRAANTVAELPGLRALEAKDGTVSRQELEDRASVVFWKWIDARVTGQRTRLERFCLQPGQPPATPTQLTNIAVGSSELVQVIVDDNGLDHCQVDVIWSAQVDGGEYQNVTSHLYLARATTATSKRGLSSLDCPNCAGPLADSDLVKCNYCGEPLAGGKHEWSLEAVS
jgi:hypothetical protein